jgi:hypothetical protein
MREIGVIGTSGALSWRPMLWQLMQMRNRRAIPAEQVGQIPGLGGFTGMQVAAKPVTISSTEGKLHRFLDGE